MSQRRRGLILLGLALVLGGLAASDVARRERAADRRLGPGVTVVVARSDLPPGRRLRPRDLTVRSVPSRFVPPDAAAATEEVAGARLAAGLPAGGYVTAAHVAPAVAAGPSVRRGERAVEVVAAGDPDLVIPGSRVDVLVTRERGGTALALQDVEVLAAGRGSRGAEPPAGAAAASQVTATLRVSLRQAVFLTAAQSFAREVRLLPRAAGDRRRAAAVRIGAGL